MKSKDLYFEYIEDFADYIVEKVELDEELFLTVVGKFEEAKEILKNVMQHEDVNFEALEIESPIMDNYCDEFVIFLWMNDGVLEIGCEKLKDEEGYYTNPCGDVVFMLDNCSSKIIPLCECSELYFVNIEDECDCDEEYYDYCECDDENDIYGFTVNNETDNRHSKFTFYSSSPLNKTDIYSMLKEFGI